MPNTLSRLARTQVTKKLAPDQPGAKKLTQRYGEALVCVRYRQNLEAGRRYTTVELVVDEGPILSSRKAPPEVHLRIPYDDLTLRKAIQSHGGIWDNKKLLWRLHRDAVQALQRHIHTLRTLPIVDSENGKE